MNCNLAATLKMLNTQIAVIGYGNDLRRDDGVGQQIAETVAHWGVPNVRSLSVYQLTPELTETLLDCDTVIFVDAYVAKAGDSVCVTALEPADLSHAIAHKLDPRSLLGLLQRLYGHTLKAWLIAVPAIDFEYGTTLSDVAERGMADALEEIDYLIRTHSQQPLMIS